LTNWSIRINIHLARKKKFIAERFWSTEELEKLEEGIKLFGVDVHKLKEHIGTSRPKYVDPIARF